MKKNTKIWIVWSALVLALVILTIAGGCQLKDDKPVLVKPTGTPTVYPTNTTAPVPTDTPTPLPTDTPTPVPTDTPTPTPSPTDTPTPTPTETPTPEPTNTPTPRPASEAAKPTPTPEMAGENYFYGAGGRKIYTDKPMLAITIDDGPFPWYTSPIMDLFEEYNSRATFFVCGYKLYNYPDTTKEAYQRGFQIGNHTLNHPYLTKLTTEEMTKEIKNNEDLIRKYAGVEGVIMLRPPYGLYNADVAAIANVPMIGWNVESGDWMVKDKDIDVASAAVRDNILKGAGDGNIILCHDLYKCTYNGLVQAIPILIERGYQLVTMDELFFAKGVTAQNGKYYTCVGK